MTQRIQDRLSSVHAAPHLTAPGAASDNWVGGDNGNGDWNTAGDWSNGVPPASATATFATGYFGYTVTGDATIGAIVVDGDGVTFDGAITQNTGGPGTFLTALDAAYVTFDSNSFVTGGALDFTAGSLLDVQGYFVTTGGSADVMIVEGLSASAISSGALTVNQLYVEYGASFTGDVTLTEGGTLLLDTSSSFGGSITLQGDAQIYEASAYGAGGQGSIADGITGDGGTLNLAADPGATLLVTGTISDVALLVSGGNVELNNTADSFAGAIQVQDGTLTMDTASANLQYVLTNGEVAFADAGMVLPEAQVFAGGDSSTVSAGAASVLVYNDAGALSFIGGSLSATVVGGTGSLSVTGGAGNDIIYGGAGATAFTGGSGDDTVVGGAGIVVATGGSGADLIYGGTSGHDVLATGAGNTTLVGGAGASFIANGCGSAVVVASQGGNINASAASGNDTLFAGGSATTIVGGIAGVETDVLGAGNATVFGGSGTAEIFGAGGALNITAVQGFGGGTIEVAGVSLAQLSISLVNFSGGEAAQVLANETVSGGNTYLQLSDNTHIDLFGITGLTSANFT